MQQESVVLAEAFDQEFIKYLKIIGETPTLFRPIDNSHTYRRFHLKRFKYNIFYSVKEKTKVVEVIGIFHPSRSPDRWKERIK